MVGGDVRAAAQRLSIGGDGGGGDGSGDDESRVSSAPVSDGAADELVDLLLSADGNYVQELLLEEAAKLADAAVRDTIAATGEAAPLTTLRDVLRRQSGSPTRPSASCPCQTSSARPRRGALPSQRAPTITSHKR